MSSRSSSLSDLSIRGHLPPRGHQQRPVTNSNKERKRGQRLDWNEFNSRPGTVPVNALLDQNDQLSIESVPIPLSSRVHHHGRVTTPTKAPRHSWKTRGGRRNGGPSPLVKPLHHQYNENKDELLVTGGELMSSSEFQQERAAGGERRKVDCVNVPRTKSYTETASHSRSHSGHQSQSKSISRSHSHSGSRSHSGFHSRSISDSQSQSGGTTSDLSDIALDDSVDQISSEIDAILNGISTGLILSEKDTNSPSLPYLEGSSKRIHEPPSRVKDSKTRLNGNSLLTRRETMKEMDSVFQSDTDTTSFTNCKEDLLTLSKPLNAEVAIDKSAAIKDSAAIKIQRWFRERKIKQRKAELQELLKSKKNKMKIALEQQHSFNEEEEVALHEKQQRREAKMRAARQAAIEELKKKREEKKQEREQLIAEEMAELEAKGKVKKRRETTTKKKKKLEQANGGISCNVEGKTEDAELNKDGDIAKEETQGKDEKGRTQEKKETENEKETEIDEFFKAGKRKPLSPSSVPPPATPPAPPPPVSNTMDSIYATLKELEEAPPPLPGAESSPIAYLSMENIQKLNMTETRDNSKLQTILTYLDEVEKSDHAPEQEIKEQPTGEGGTGVLNGQLEAASAVANDVTTTILTQRMEIDNKNKTVDMLQKALKQQRELTVYHAKEMEKEAQKRLELQKQEYETTIQRHQCFIDQLIDDKKVLSDKCELLIKELKETDKKSKTKITNMENQHAAELEKQKQTHVAAEKVRHERWRAEETQRIKEATVKSLEPEIQRIIGKGKAEIQKLKAVHEAELLQSDERVSRRFTQQIEDLRLQNAQEKELACQHERELARQKYEQLAEQEERSYQQLRKKLYSEIQQEREKLTAEMNGHNNALEKQIKDMKETHFNELSALKSEQEIRIVELQRSHSAEFKELQERTKIEKQMWEENYLKKQETILMTREREMRESLRRERDMEIETVIQKLEKETAAARDETERGAESRIKRIREKYETELREVERSEKNTLQKFNTMKGQLSDLEGEVVKLRSHLRLKEEEVAEINQIASRLTRERDQFADIVRQEFAERLISVEEENRQIKLEISELQAKHKLELERLQRGKERELAEVHSRVKQALAKKEENLKTLRTQHQAALKRADHLEMLLEQQRKELLKR